MRLEISKRNFFISITIISFLLIGALIISTINSQEDNLDIPTSNNPVKTAAQVAPQNSGGGCVERSSDAGASCSLWDNCYECKYQCNGEVCIADPNATRAAPPPASTNSGTDRLEEGRGSNNNPNPAPNPTPSPAPTVNTPVKREDGVRCNNCAAQCQSGLGENCGYRNSNYSDVSVCVGRTLTGIQACDRYIGAHPQPDATVVVNPEAGAQQNLNIRDINEVYRDAAAIIATPDTRTTNPCDLRDWSMPPFCQLVRDNPAQQTCTMRATDPETGNEVIFDEPYSQRSTVTTESRCRNELSNHQNESIVPLTPDLGSDSLQGPGESRCDLANGYLNSETCKISNDSSNPEMCRVSVIENGEERGLSYFIWVNTNRVDPEAMANAARTTCLDRLNSESKTRIPEFTFLNLINTVSAQEAPPIPNVIDINALEKGVYTLDVPGYQSATVTITTDNISIVGFEDTNANGIKDAGEPDIDLSQFQVQISKTQELRTYDLESGWNLIGLPFVSDDLATASDLAVQIASQGVAPTQVSKYDSGNWIHYVVRVDSNGEVVEYGPDFQLVPGEGYFVRTFNEGQVILEGNTFESGVPISLTKGWNLRSIQSQRAYTATTFLQTCRVNNIICSQVSKYENGLYDSVVELNGQYFGNDFPILEQLGYFIKVNGGGGTITP